MLDFLYTVAWTCDLVLVGRRVIETMNTGFYFPGTLENHKSHFFKDRQKLFGSVKAYSPGDTIY